MKVVFVVRCGLNKRGGKDLVLVVLAGCFSQLLVS